MRRGPVAGGTAGVPLVAGGQERWVGRTANLDVVRRCGLRRYGIHCQPSRWIGEDIARQWWCELLTFTWCNLVIICNVLHLKKLLCSQISHIYIYFIQYPTNQKQGTGTVVVSLPSALCLRSSHEDAREDDCGTAR